MTKIWDHYKTCHAEMGLIDVRTFDNSLNRSVGTRYSIHRGSIVERKARGNSLNNYLPNIESGWEFTKLLSQISKIFLNSFLNSKVLLQSSYV